MEQLDPNQASFLAKGAEIDELAGELVQEGFPIGRGGGQQQRSGLDLQQLTAPSEFVLSVAVGQKAEVADTHEA